MSAFAARGAKLRVAPIDDTGTVIMEEFEKLFNARTKAIMPVHLYGHPAALREFTALAEKHNVLLFEDAAQAHAASLDGVPVGAWGVAGSFSFYPTKNMTSGEGGMVSTPDAAFARRVRLLRVRRPVRSVRTQPEQQG